MHPVPYHRPSTIDGALTLMRVLDSARLIAGGTDLLLRMKAGGARPNALISLRNIEELSQVSIDVSAGARLGALVSLADLENNAELMQKWPVLGQCLRHFASVQIRNAATLGGNLCNASPAADLAPPLLVLDAQALLVGLQGRRSVPLADFFVGPGRTCLGPDELLEAVQIDAPHLDQRAIFFKRMRTAMDVALVSVAAMVVVQDGVLTEVRLAAGSVAAVPMRLRGAEDLLRGQRASPALFTEARAKAMAEVRPITDLRAGADYRRQLVGVYLQRALHALCGEES